MNVDQLLGGSAGLEQVARELGVDSSTVQAGAAALLPALLGGFKKQATGAQGGLDGLLGMLGGMGGGGLLDAVLAPQPTAVDPGNQILGQIFGSKDVSRTVASQAAGASGLSPDLLKKLLPVLAMAVAGFMSRQAGAQAGAGGLGGLGGLVGQVLGGLSGGRSGSTGGVAGLASLLDLNGDGNPLDDIMRMVGGNR